MPTDNTGKYDGSGVPLTPMQSEWGQPDKGSAKLRQVLDNYYVDKTHTNDWRSDSDASSPDRRIPKGYDVVPNQYDPYCNYLGYEAGNKVIVGWDEYKILEQTVQSVPIVYAENLQTIDGQGGKERI